MASISVQFPKPDGTTVTGEFIVEDGDKFRRALETFLRAQGINMEGMNYNQAADEIAKQLAKHVNRTAKAYRHSELQQTSEQTVQDEVGFIDEQPGQPPI